LQIVYGWNYSPTLAVLL